MGESMSLYEFTRLIKMGLKLDRYFLDKKLIKYEVADALGEPILAENELDKHLEKYPRDEVALCHKAMILKSRGDIDSTIEYLKRAVKSHASYPNSRYLLGQVYLELEEFELARTYLYSGIIIQEDTEILKDLGKAYIGLGNDKEAINCFKKIIKRDKSNHEAYNMLINIYERTNKDNEVRKYEKLLNEIS